MRTNIDLEDNLVEEAFSLTGVRTKRELVHLALRELIASRKKKDLFDLSGQIDFSEGLDHKNLREMNADPD
ncbi:MAG: type II toxin-antitoxin system VapB family antitoxin [Gammaproteobacteria bacterium]|nr:type II toxin-antitoxin system VapB family antitoxin [Gammaproteobacteria bacterium]